MKTGILLINLGTPDSPKKSDVRKYLTEFLNDPRVIDISAAGRFVLVNGIIVPFRAGNSAKLYSAIWTPEGSPLLLNSQRAAKALQLALGDQYVVELGMRYQKPTLASALERLRLQQVDKIVVLPLYPHYASSSSGSSIEKTLALIAAWEVTPSVSVISKFYDQPAFIEACVAVAKKYNLADYQHFLFSYHGLPERHIRKSSACYGKDTCSLDTCCNSIGPDNAYCYRAACFDTTRKLVSRLGLQEGSYTTSFQSRLDDKWIKPYSDKVVIEKAKAGLKKMLVFSPAFVADCLETIYEIGIEYQELFHKHGGEKIQLVESLNDSPAWISALKQLVTENS
jgi:ferrochelatase